MDNGVFVDRDGRDFRAMAKEVGVSPEEICVEADLSIAALYKVYRDAPGTLPRTRDRVAKALDRLREKRKASA